MADISYTQSSILVSVVGTDGTGTETNTVDADANGNLKVKDYSVGPVTPGTAASGSALIGGQYNTVLPTLTNTQQSALQVDSSGRLLIGALATGSNTIGAVTGSGNFTVVGTGTDNTANSTSKLPVLVARANTSAPSWSDGNMVPLSVDANGALRVSGSAGGTSSGFTSAFPSNGTAAGFNDGTNMQGARVFDADTGGGTQYVLGAVLRKSASGGSVEAGTSSDPLRVDPTGTTTQPVSGTVTANIGSSGSLALDATLTGGTQKAIVRGGAKGSTAAADVTSTASGANHQPLDVAIYDASGNQITSFGGGTQFADGAARGSATGTLMMVDDGTNIQSVSGDSSGRININNIAGTVSLPTGAATGVAQGSTTSGQSGTLAQGAVTTAAPSYTNAQTSPLSLTTAGLLRTEARVSDGTNTATVVAASTAAATTDKALVVRLPTVQYSNNIPSSIEPIVIGGEDDNGQAQFLKLDTGGRAYSIPLASQQYATFQSNISSTSNSVVTNIAGGQIGIIIDVAGSVTGSSPQMVITVQDVAPNDTSRVCGPVTTIATITAAGTYQGVCNTLSNAVRVTWTVTGSTPVFNNTTISVVTHISEGNIGDLGGTGTIAANGAIVQFSTESMSTSGIVITGTWTATLQFEASVDASNWIAVKAASATTLVNASSTTANGTYLVDIAGFSWLRVRCSAYTSGTATVNISNSPAFGDQLKYVDSVGAQSVAGRQVATYMGATGTFTPAASATDIFVINGSATKTIKVLRLTLSGTQTTAGNIGTISVIKRSTANTGGTPVSTTKVPTDSTFAAATATVQHYTANPSGVGTAVGTVWQPRVLVPAPATATASPPTIMDLDIKAIMAGQPIVLRGTAEGLAINMNATVPTGAANFQVCITWTEE